jgi:hypothetical protein
MPDDRDDRAGPAGPGWSGTGLPRGRNRFGNGTDPAVDPGLKRGASAAGARWLLPVAPPVRAGARFGAGNLVERPDDHAPPTAAQ